MTGLRINSIVIDGAWPRGARFLGVAASSLAHMGAVAGLIWILQQPLTSLGVVEIAIELDGTARSSDSYGAGDLATASDSAAQQASPADTLPSEMVQSRAIDRASEEVSGLDIPTAENAEVAPSPQPVQPHPTQPPAAKKGQTAQPALSATRVRHDQRERPRAAGRGETANATSAGGSGRAAGASQAGGMSRASYAALVVAQIQARKFYPAGARAGGAVAFSLAIGPSGSVTRFRITRSSGSDALDQAARQIVTSIHPPPPPGGSFSGSAILRFGTVR